MFKLILPILLTVLTLQVVAERQTGSLIPGKSLEVVKNRKLELTAEALPDQRFSIAVIYTQQPAQLSPALTNDDWNDLPTFEPIMLD